MSGSEIVGHALKIVQADDAFRRGSARNCSCRIGLEIDVLGARPDRGLEPLATLRLRTIPAAAVFRTSHRGDDRPRSRGDELRHVDAGRQEIEPILDELATMRHQRAMASEQLLGIVGGQRGADQAHSLSAFELLVEFFFGEHQRRRPTVGAVVRIAHQMSIGQQGFDLAGREPVAGFDRRFAANHVQQLVEQIATFAAALPSTANCSTILRRISAAGKFASIAG